MSRFFNPTNVIIFLLFSTFIACDKIAGNDTSDKAKTYYQEGRAKLNVSNYPAAMEAFLHAEKQAENSDNDSILILTTLAMMDLSDSICDTQEKIRYALKACAIYYKNNEYDSIRATLIRLDNWNTLIVNPQYVNELTHYASIIQEQDSLSLTGDSLRIRDISHNIRHLCNLNFTELHFCDDMKSFNPYDYIELIKAHGNWQNEITNDSTNITAEKANLITTSLWNQGFDKEAGDFIHFYRKYYKEKEMTYLAQKVKAPNVDKDPNVCRYQILEKVEIHEPDPNDPTFPRTFQDNVKSVVTKFHYEEELMHEQTLKTQRIMLINISIISLAVIILIAMHSRIISLRRSKLEDSNIQSAAELRAALNNLEDKHIKTLTHLCNTYYDSYNNQSTKSKIAREALQTITEIADGDDFFTRLEEKLNESEDNLTTKFRNEMADVKESDIKLFICNAIGLTIPAICLLLKEKRDVIYARRLRLRAKIQESDAIDKETFLNHLK